MKVLVVDLELEDGDIYERHGNQERSSVERNRHQCNQWLLWLVCNCRFRDTLARAKVRYQNDQKVGLWRYLSFGKKEYIRYNYDNQTAEFLDSSLCKADTFYTKVETNGLFLLNAVDSPPVYLGFKDEINITLGHNVILPIDMLGKSFQGVAVASFVVDRTGKISHVEIERSLSESFDRVLQYAVSTISGDWIPAKVNNIPVEVKMSVLVRVYNKGFLPNSSASNPSVQMTIRLVTK